MIGSIIYLAIVVIVIAGMWKTFEKAGQPGWGCIIPIYNIYLMTKIAAKPAWWVIMFFIPLVNIVFAIMLYNEIAKKFGQGIGFTIGLILLLSVVRCADFYSLWTKCGLLGRPVSVVSWDLFCL